MSVTFASIALLTLGGAIAAVTMRNLVHCALALTLAFSGLAALYLRLDAQFAGFAQVLVYIGAVAILVVFAILLTPGSDPPNLRTFSSGWLIGPGIAILVFAVLARFILTSKSTARQLPAVPEATVRQIGDQLMTKYILPLEVVGLLLTAALIGAVIIAMRESEPGLNVQDPKSKVQTEAP